MISPASPPPPACATSACTASTARCNTPRPPPGAVKHAVLDWGFLHQGRLARDYHALFGEHPADTLRS